MSRIVGRYVKLRHAGREHVGLSPFDAEKTPSFAVNDSKGFYHCFASGEHGDIFAFVMKAEGLSFTEAVECLAAQAGIELPKSSPAAAERDERGARLRRLIETAFFRAALCGEAGAKARAYL